MQAGVTLKVRTGPYSPTSECWECCCCAYFCYCCPCIRKHRIHMERAKEEVASKPEVHAAKPAPRQRPSVGGTISVSSAGQPKN